MTEQPFHIKNFRKMIGIQEDVLNIFILFFGWRRVLRIHPTSVCEDEPTSDTRCRGIFQNVGGIPPPFRNDLNSAQ